MPLPGASGGSVVVIQRGSKLRPFLGLRCGQGYSAWFLDVLDVDGHHSVHRVRPGLGPDGDSVAALLFVVGRLFECEYAVAGEGEVVAVRTGETQGDRGPLGVAGGVAAYLPAGGGVLGVVVNGLRAGQFGRLVHIGDNHVDVQFPTLVVGVSGLNGDLVVVVATGVGRALVVGHVPEGEHAARNVEVCPVRSSQAPRDVAVALGVCGGVGGHVAGAVLIVVDDGGNPGDQRWFVHVLDGDGDLDDDGVEGVVPSRHGDLVNVISPGVGGALVVWRAGEG